MQNTRGTSSLKKGTRSSNILKILTIVIDTVGMEARLPTDKLDRVWHLVTEWLPRSNATKQEILSLLQYAAKAVHVFVRYMYNEATRVCELDHYVRLDIESLNQTCVGGIPF